MFGKLVYGQLSLKATFWKFGVMGILICAFITKAFNVFLMQRLNGMGLAYYYTHYFSPLKMDNMILFLTIGYVFSAVALGIYSIMVLFGVWRSSAEYDKSVWMRYIARLFIVLIIYIGLRAVL